MTKVKICGLKTPESVTAAIEGGADFLGFVFHPPSPRYVETEIAAYLTHYVPDSVKTVGLFVDPIDKNLDMILSNVRLDMIQLQGEETPARVLEIKSQYKKPVIKAFSIKSADDVKALLDYSAIVDWFLLDSGSGGTGVPFDWRLLEGLNLSKPWMLAGGLTAQNVAHAIASLKPDAVDVSSGVESERGMKDPDKIHSFLKVAKAL